MRSKTLSVFTDGGARGNPGPAAIGFVVKESNGRVLVKKGKKIGKATNNVAEYQAVIEALIWLRVKMKTKSSSLRLKFFLDSKLIVNQLNGIFKIKNYRLRNLVVKVREMEREIGGNVSYHFVSRTNNKEADTLVNQSLDREKS